MAMKLYYVPRTRSARPRWLLEELGSPHELVCVDPKHKPEGFEKLHPLGHVPVLEDRGTVVFESTAICLHLADQDPENRFAPPPGSVDRAHYYQWIFYALTEIEPQLNAIAAETLHKPPEARSAALLEQASGRFATAAKVLDARLAEREYLVGDRFTAADIVVGSLASWAKSMKLLGNLPALLAYSDRLHARPAAQRARAD